MAKALQAAIRPPDELGFEQLDDVEGAAGSRMAKGSQAVAAVVSTLEHRSHVITEAFIKRIKRDMGVHFGEPWSLETHATNAVADVHGHKALKKQLVIMAHLFELCREHGAAPQVEAFIAQSYKVVLETLANNGSWEMSWPILGLPDPDEKMASVLSPGEKVALAALVKEKKLLKDTQRAVRPEVPARTPGAAAGANRAAAE